jgi:hypothetical protein
MVESGVGAALVPWESFYVITGAAASALTGLQFVVVTLITDGPAKNAAAEVNTESLTAFGTPTVVHFAFALLLSGIVSAPWHSLPHLRTAVGLAGAAGLAYGALTLLRARRQTGYKPVLEDWVWHIILPLVAYGGTVAAAAMLGGDIADALFVVGGATLLLIFIGIHNAWDTVAYLAVERASSAPRPAPRPPAPAARRQRRRR